jgi:hypothetical protein
MDGYLREKKKKFPESELTLDEFAWIREAGLSKKVQHLCRGERAIARF